MSIAGGKVGRPRPVLVGIPTSVHHHGGRLLFDRNGLLYVSTGDAEQSETAQDRDALTGKILRLRPNGRAAPGNPFDNRTWSYGHRNIEGLAFDAENRLWATEFGDQKSDELNLIRRAELRWPDKRPVDELTIPIAGRRIIPDQQSLTGGLAITRSTALHRCAARSVPVRGAAARRRRGPAEGVLRRRLRSHSQRRRRAGRSPLDDDQQHRRADRPGPQRRRSSGSSWTSRTGTQSQSRMQRFGRRQRFERSAPGTPWPGSRGWLGRWTRAAGRRTASTWTWIRSTRPSMSRSTSSPIRGRDAVPSAATAAPSPPRARVVRGARTPRRPPPARAATRWLRRADPRWPGSRPGTSATMRTADSGSRLP